MSQILSQVPRQLLQQQQRLTPQLIQAMDILQLNAMALESRIQQEIDSNPALEIIPQTDEEIVQAPAAPAEAERNEGEQALVVDGSERDFERLDSLVREYDLFDDDEYRGTRSRAAAEADSEARLDAMASAPSRAASLQEYLLEQWQLCDVDAETRRLGRELIDALDAGGRLATPLDELVRQIEPPATVERLEDALARVQALDPPGIAARDLQECLVLQLEALPLDTSLERRILEEHFEDLQKNRLPQIARALGVTLDAVKAAIERISRLSLTPGLDVADHAPPSITPDVIVDFVEDEDRYDVRLARANQRDLRISNEFREALEKSRGNKQERDFLKQKIEAAASVIDAIRFRRERLLEVAKAVFETQRPFLDHGEQHIKVLRMSDLATRFDCDPSTISRTVDEKWVQTPRGIYPLRRFFTGGRESDSGEVLGWDSIKAKVREIIEREDKSSPLRDDEIAEKLSAGGIEIKRRTVAKYRAQLGVANHRQRKQFK